MHYRVLYRTNDPDRIPAGLVAVAASPGPLRAVCWDHLAREWRFNQEVATILYDPRSRDRWASVDRTTAERIARDNLATNLPTEATLRQICATALGD